MEALGLFEGEAEALADFDGLKLADGDLLGLSLEEAIAYSFIV